MSGQGAQILVSAIADPQQPRATAGGVLARYQSQPSSKLARAAKHPRIREWQKKASTNALRIREWWKRWPDASVCIATGQISGVVVLDVFA